jgi:hypothetical protein
MKAWTGSNRGRFIKVFHQSTDDVRLIGVLLSFGKETMEVRSITGKCLIHTIELNITSSEIITPLDAMNECMAIMLNERAAKQEAKDTGDSDIYEDDYIEEDDPNEGHTDGEILDYLMDIAEVDTVEALENILEKHQGDLNEKR